MTKNSKFFGKKSKLFDQLFGFHELKYVFNFSKNDGQTSKNSIKKYIQNRFHMVNFSKLQDKFNFSTNFKMTKNFMIFGKNPFLLINYLNFTN